MHYRTDPCPIQITRVPILTDPPGLGVVKAKMITTEEAKAIFPTPERKDRHKPGYMAEYMRKRRAKKIAP
jgi:hypothetical protein